MAANGIAVVSAGIIGAAHAADYPTYLPRVEGLAAQLDTVCDARGELAAKLARDWLSGARVLILDEPTSALGQKQQMEVLKAIARVPAPGDIAIIFITRNEAHAKLVADRFTFHSLGEVMVVKRAQSSRARKSAT